LSACIAALSTAAHVVPHLLARFAAFLKADCTIAVGIEAIEPRQRRAGELFLAHDAVAVGIRRVRQAGAVSVSSTPGEARPAGSFAFGAGLAVPSAPRLELGEAELTVAVGIDSLESLAARGPAIGRIDATVAVDVHPPEHFADALLDIGAGHDSRLRATRIGGGAGQRDARG
jgi:hypothetical protein